MDADKVIKRFKSISMCPYLVGYTVKEGGMIKTIGCRDEEVANQIVEQFEKTGKIRTGFVEFVEPESVYKLEVKQYFVKLPREGNE